MIYYLIPIFYYICGTCFFIMYDLYYNINNNKIITYNSINFNNDLTNKLINDDDINFNPILDENL